MFISGMMDRSWAWSEILLACFCIALLDGLYSRYWHPLAKYPGPFWSSVTNLWRFVTFYAGKHHLVDQELHAKHGPILRTGPSSLSFSTLAAYESIYGFHSATEKGDWYGPARDTTSKYNPLFSIRTNEEHRRQRKKVLPAAFGNSKVALYRPVLERHIEQLMIEIKQALSDSSSGIVDLAEPLHHFIFDALYEVAFGELPQYNTPEDRAKASKAIQMATKGLGTGYLPWLGNLISWKPLANLMRLPKYNKNGQLMGFSAIARQSFTRVAEGREAILQSSQASILQNLILMSEKDEESLPSRVVTLESFNSLFAGTGTIAAALTTVLYHLAQPAGKAWQDRIRSDSADRTSSSLSAVLKETLRLNPPFPSGIPRTTTTETAIAIDSSTSIIVPKNTHVSCNLYVLGRSPEIWGLEAETWDPERWLTRSSTSDVDDNKPSRDLSLEERFLVFGKGPRSCVGREIAMVLITDTISKFLQLYYVKSAEPLEGGNFFEMQYKNFVVELVQR